ncbi:MAG TPA: Mur ligase family protein [Bdellovibrionota bacterium]|nr:Mur ligase family protein [Bdellovibrionota bacterium]
MNRSPSDIPERLSQLQRRGIRLELESVRKVAKALDLLSFPARVLHVCGTNGKGSVCWVADSLLREHGFKVGRYMSPHLQRFSERIVVDNKQIEDETLDRLSGIVLDCSETVKCPLTFFEATTLVALLFFKEKKVDYLVLEAGMGGRLDATNILDGDVVALPSIGIDHAEWLGNSEEAITREKCGMLKPGTLLVSGPLSSSLERVVEEEVVKHKCGWERWGRDFSLTPDWRFKSNGYVMTIRHPLDAIYQQVNAGVALAAVEKLLPKFNDSSVQRAFENVELPGRFEWVNPNLCLDVAHNPHGVQALLSALPSDQELEFWFAASRGKDIHSMIDLLQSRGKIYYLNVAHERLMNELEFRNTFPDLSSKISGVINIEEVRWNRLSRPTVICGSCFLIGEVKQRMERG